MCVRVCPCVYVGKVHVNRFKATVLGEWTSAEVGHKVMAMVTRSRVRLTRIRARVTRSRVRLTRIRARVTSLMRCCGGGVECLSRLRRVMCTVMRTPHEGSWF